ncbi:hypothetical protein EVA_11270 [gut metagenome]|uniref:Uncharacterized protein n=1 Tax=gut metagenome TaxID=749906 RepID=J9GLJ4_9ZZZZ
MGRMILSFHWGIMETRESNTMTVIYGMKNGTLMFPLTI